MNVCLYGTYTNPHFWTDLNQTLHASPLGLEEVVGYVWTPQYFNFPTFSTYFVGSECPFTRGRWLPAPESPATALYPWCGTCWCDVTDVTCTCAIHRKRGEVNGMHVCVWKWKPDETGRKWIMNCTCSCIAFIQMITKNLSNFRPSSFRTLSRDNTFFCLLNLSRRSSDMFR
jgi:hypothetical protein